MVNDENCPPISRSELNSSYQSLNPDTMEHNTQYESLAMVSKVAGGVADTHNKSLPTYLLLSICINAFAA